MYNKMIVSYRVVCSHNPQKPDKFFVDICRDGFCSHEVLLKMQKKRYGDDKLESLCSVGRGIMIRESRDGNIRLVYTSHNDIMARLAQAKIREKIDPLILATFADMKKKGRFQTIHESLIECNNELVTACSQKGYAESLQEEDALKAAEKAERLARLKEIRRNFYAQQKYAAQPHLYLRQAQAERSGD